ncbi:MAG: PQQ-binding-like beta-propeller repeat protein [Natrialbaceae archaeon]|nr:PQQ-binding-like beta-propeller repeat protein [Natrialbaceae archaeon]
MKRRDAIRSALAVGAGCLAGCLDQFDQESVGGGLDGWSMFRANSYNTGRLDDTRGPADDPRVSWSVQTGGDIWGSAAVAQERVYIPSYDGYCYAFDATDGSELWRYELGEVTDSSPAITEELVVLGGFDKRIHGIDRETGDRRWRFDADGIVRSSPTIRDGTVYIGTHCQVAECRRDVYDINPDGPGYLVALDGGTGEVRWRFETGAGVVSTPAIDETTAYVGGTDGVVYAVDRESGEEEWTFETNEAIFSSPALEGETLYIGDTAGVVFAIDVSDGTEEWHFQLPPRMKEGSPAVGDDTIFIGSGGFGHGSVIYGIDRADGTETWSTGVSGVVLGSSPALVQDRIYVGTLVPETNETASQSGAMVALSTSGDLVWELTVDADFNGGGEGFGSSPAVDNGRLVVGSESGHLYSIE